jgi:hypothetical protein
MAKDAEELRLIVTNSVINAVRNAPKVPATKAGRKQVFKIIRNHVRQLEREHNVVIDYTVDLSVERGLFIDVTIK